MRAVVQRVSHASVTIHDPELSDDPSGDWVTGSIDQGLLVLVGVGPNDGEAEAKWLANKVAHLRIFKDDSGKMNKSVIDLGGAILAVSQFTLYGDCRRGRRPAFTGAASPELAAPLFERFVELVRSTGARCETGRFQASMRVELLNDGPVTLILDTDDLKRD